MRVLKYVGAACALLILTALIAAYLCLRASLPRLDGALARSEERRVGKECSS